MNPVQRPLENVFKHPPIIMDLAVGTGPTATMDFVTTARVLSLKLCIFYLDLCCLDARTLFRFLYLL